jgi:hypothetical protein
MPLVVGNDGLSAQFEVHKERAQLRGAGLLLNSLGQLAACMTRKRMMPAQMAQPLIGYGDRVDRKISTSPECFRADLERSSGSSGAASSVPGGRHPLGKGVVS